MVISRSTKIALVCTLLCLLLFCFAFSFFGDCSASALGTYTDYNFPYTDLSFLSPILCYPSNGSSAYSLNHDNDHFLVTGTHGISAISFDFSFGGFSGSGLLRNNETSSNSVTLTFSLGFRSLPVPCNLSMNWSYRSSNSPGYTPSADLYFHSGTVTIDNSSKNIICTLNVFDKTVTGVPVAILTISLLDFPFYLGSAYLDSIVAIDTSSSFNVAFVPPRDLSATYTDGFNAGYNSGYQFGFDEANNTVDTSSASYQAGVGYANSVVNESSASWGAGYSKGASDASTATFGSLISAVFDVPVKVFTSLFDYNILGVNMLSFVGSLLALGAVISILRFIL